jgi:hypothetical protein
MARLCGAVTMPGRRNRRQRPGSGWPGGVAPSRRQAAGTGDSGPASNSCLSAEAGLAVGGA